MNRTHRPSTWTGALLVGLAALGGAPSLSAAPKAPACTAEATHYTCSCTMMHLDGQKLARYRIGRARMYELCHCPPGDDAAHDACKKGVIRERAGCPRDEVGWCPAEAKRATKVWQAKHPK